MSAHPGLRDITVLERGWLSSNNVLLHGARPTDPCVLVDSGYVSHAAQTVDLVRYALGQANLAEVVNTHLHSDHCGGNAALQRAFGSSIAIPDSEADAVKRWDMSQLTFEATGQRCEPFDFQRTLEAGTSRQFGAWAWEALAAPGHDPHSLVLYQPDQRVLISADALWENGFGVVFPELVGEPGFDAVRSTLDLISHLDLGLVIPGHGPPFTDVHRALERAYRRLDSFIQDPQHHALHASKVLIKFHLLEVRSQPLAELLPWLQGTPYFAAVHQRYFYQRNFEAWCRGVLVGLSESGCIRIDAGIASDV
jgi:glyoxylase-like metal-dependent hydrolase (beta-lactamase superfamily II)